MYPLLKLLHVIAVIAFLGNITTGLFWHAHAARTRDPKLASGVIFMMRVAPLQRQLRALAEAAVQAGTFEYAHYHAVAV